MAGADVWFESAGERLFARVWGSGDPLVLLHGSGLSTHASFAGLAERVSGTFQVIACDVRGFGRSVSPDPDTHTWDQYVADLVALLDHLSLSSAIVGGQSFGAGIALATALGRPQRARGLVLAQPGYAGAEIGQTEAQRSVWIQGRSLVEKAGTHGLLQAMLRTQSDEVGRAWVREAVAQHDEASFMAAHRGHMATSQPFQRLAELESIDAPVLLIAGDDAAHDPLITAMYAQHLPRVIHGKTTSPVALTWVPDLLTMRRLYTS